MRISEYAVRRYGPLRDTGKVLPANFNLIYGYNEAGKTLTIDALIKLLFGKASREKDFIAIERVNELPDGYIVVENRDNEEIKLSGKKTLSSVIELSPGELSNIFVIRNSDLSIANEGDFYSNITERLTGLRTGYITTVIDALLEQGRLTPTGMFRDAGEERLRSRIDKAIQLIDIMDTLIEECRTKDIDTIEQKIIAAHERLKNIDSEIGELNDARLREQYEKGCEAHEKLIDAREAMQRIEQFNEPDLQKWRDNQRDLERLTDERRRTMEELEGKREALREVTDEVQEHEAACKQSEEKKRRLDETIRPLLRQYEEQRALVPAFESRKKFFGIAGILSGILFGISLVGVLLAPGTFFYAVTALLFVLLTITGIVYYVTLRKLAEVSAGFQRLVTAAGRYQLDAENLPRMEEKIETFENEYRHMQEKLQNRRTDMHNLQQQVEQLESKKLPEIDRTIRTCNEQIDSIIDTSGEETIQHYREKLQEKIKLQNVMQTQATLLKRDFGTRQDSVHGNIPYWQEEINELERYKDKAQTIKYDERKLTGLQREKETRNKELETLQEQRSGIDESMKDIERKVNNLLQTGDEYMYCNTVNDLVSLQTMLRAYVDRHATTRDDVLTTIDVFKSIQEEEQKKVGELFGENRPVSEYYDRITGGRYKQVEYDQVNGSIEVVQENGNRLAAAKLSGGACDQLYFAVRIALGEELLEGDTGFFILDDPFIKSDVHRLQEQINMLRYIADRGWQILFFSAKSEVLDALGEDIRDGKVTLIDYRRAIV